MAEHTPGPWVYRTASNPFAGAGRFVVERDTDTGERTLICEMPHAIPVASRQRESHANAEFIVRACNNHTTLVEALEAFQFPIPEHIGDDHFADDYQIEVRVSMRAIRRARAAIRAAKGETP